MKVKKKKKNQKIKNQKSKDRAPLAPNLYIVLLLVVRL